MILILRFANWAQANWLALVALLTVYWMLFLALIAASWLFGYWYNALHGTKTFDIASCWQGVTATGMAFASILALAKAGWTKYQTDSELNSEPGQPIQREGEP